MPFQKGNKFGCRGRKKGVRPKRITDWEEFGKELLHSGLPRCMDIMRKSDDDRFMNYFTKMLEYFKPRAQRIEIENANPIKLFLSMDPKERTEYLQTLKDKTNGKR